MSERFSDVLAVFRRYSSIRCFGLCGDEGVCDECMTRMADRFEKAHDREIRMTSKAEFARGYEDGRRSKDADHAAVALKLSRLRFDGGSHDNLCKIAYAIYPCATGWTVESSKGLRDRLIELLGGVHEHCCDSGRGCACGNRDSGDSGEHAEAMTYAPDSQESPILANSGVDDGGKVTITDEFREAIETATKTYEGSWYEMNDADHTICHITEGELLGIADRIEERFGRIRHQQDAVLQSTITYLIEECNRLQAECDRLTVALDELHADPANDVICRLERQRDELLELLKDAATEYQLSQSGWSYGAVVSQTISLERENAELQAKLEEADAAIANWREREMSFDAAQGKLDAIREALDGNH